MAQSRFKWFIIYESGFTETFEGTFLEMVKDWGVAEPIAIIRGRPA